MYTINESEFIGESLPKINDNFSELNTNITTVSNKVTNLISLSSAFYTNDSANFYSSNYEIAVFSGGTINKSSIIQSLTNYTKLIYPIAIYLTLEYSSLPSSNIKFYYKANSSSGFTLLSDSLYLVANSKQLFTFMDLGFYDWQIEYPTASPVPGTINLSYRYYN